MAEPETRDIEQPHPRRRHTWRHILPGLFLLLVVSFFALYFGFNYFGERLLRNYLQEKIHASSKGLYRVDFTTLHLNILTGKVVINGFELIPDTMQYQRLKSQGKVARSLYRVSISSLTIDRVHFRQIFAGKRINFRQLTVQHPMVGIVGSPDTLAAKRNKWRVIYEDLYPAVSGFFNDFHIDSVKVNHGLLSTSFGAKTGRKTTGEYEFSSVLRDVSVNPFSYYNHERVFYSRDIELVIHNFESQLADSLYSLRADEIGFSLTKSTLYGKKVILSPNFNSQRIRQVQNGDLFRIDLPAFSIRGIDLYRAMMDREVEISAVNLTDFFIRVYRNNPSPEPMYHKKSRKKLTLAGLYTVVAKELRFISIDSLSLRNGSCDYYGSLTDIKPELHIGTFNLELSRFRLDSLAHLDQSRIFYSKAIELDLKRISLFLRDGIHRINASAISFSTMKSVIDLHEATIFPDLKKNLRQTANRRNTISVSLPRLVFTGIDLKKVFNRRILDFDRLIISEPDVRYTRFRASKNPDPRFKKPEDFFETENEEVVYDLVKKYLWAIRGSEIRFSQGIFELSLGQDGTKLPLLKTNFELTMQQFLIDSIHGMNEQGYFYSRDFDLDLHEVSLCSPDSLKFLRVGRVHVVTKDSLIEADNVNVYKSSSPLQFSTIQNKRQSMSVEFSLRKLRLSGLNHKRLFLENILVASQIDLENPTLSLRTSKIIHPEGPPEKTQLLQTKTLLQTFEIGRFVVRNGSFSYDGEEDRKASYFSLKDIDFAVVDATVHIPERGVRDGLIKFDSLQLKVIPLRAVIADSAYALEARSLEVRSYPADIILQGVKAVPLKPWNEMPGRKSRATITIPEIRFNGFYFDRAIFDDQWLLEGLYVENPKVTVELKDEGSETGNVKGETKDVEKLKGLVQNHPGGFFRIPPFMKTLAVRKVSISGASGSLIRHQNGCTSSYSLNDAMIEVTRFRADSATRSNPVGTPFFNADDIKISAPGFSWLSADSMYTYSFSRFGLSTGSANAFIDSLSVTPNFNRYDFSRKLGFQTDRIMLTVPRVRVHQLDFQGMVSDQKVQASKVSLADATFESYRDKRVPFPTWQRPSMPGKMIEGITFPICIDTIDLQNGYVSYEEQNGNEPGRIFFDRINATLTGFCTPSGSSTPSGSMRRLGLHSTLNMMGTAPAEAWFQFLINHPRDSFTLRANVGEFDLKQINPMISKLLPVSIRQGTATRTEIFQINANSDKAVGNMNFRYNDLSIRLHPTKPDAWSRFEQLLLTGFVNLLLADNNPDDDGKMKNGIIYYERDPSRGFFNFVWKSVLSGIKSSIGVNSKKQKELKKEQKTAKK